MFEVVIGTTPVDLGAVVGVPTIGRSVGTYRLQNRGPETVYRTQSVASPDAVAVRGFRHATGTYIDVRIPTSDLGGATWLWTSTGNATVIAEIAIR